MRIGDGEIVRMVGNIGYQVKEEYRGKGYAVAACYLLCSLARRHGMKELFITCTPEITLPKGCAKKLGQNFGKWSMFQMDTTYIKGVRRN